MSRVITRLIRDVKENLNLDGSSVKADNTVKINGRVVDPTNLESPIITDDLQIISPGDIDYDPELFEPTNYTVGSPGTPIPTYNYNQIAPPSHEQTIDVIRLFREGISDYSQVSLNRYKALNAIPYAVFRNGTRRQVTWEEVFDPRQPTGSTSINIAQLAEARNQHFWLNDNGAHVTSDSRSAWENEYEESDHGSLSAPTLEQPWHNLLLNSLGILLRRGLINLAGLSRDSISFYDGTGNDIDNITAVFGSSGAQIGKNTENHLILSNEGLSAYDGDGNLIPVYADNIEAHQAVIDNLGATYATITNLDAANGNIDNLTSIMMSALYADIDSLTADEIDALNLNAINAAIRNLETNNFTAENLIAINALIDTLRAHRITTDILEAGYADIELANVNNAWIENGVIKNEAVTSAQIQGVSASKLTAGEINADNIIVRNLQAVNLKVGRLNGNPVIGGYEVVSTSLNGYSSKNPVNEGWYEYVNNTYILSQDTSVRNGVVYYKTADRVDLYDQATIDQKFSDVDARIDSQIETWTGTAVPLLTNYPANQWNSDSRADHVGDIYYVINAGNQYDGFTYRFAYDSTQQSYKWVLIRDNAVTDAISRIVTAEGNIGTLQSFQSDTETWINETDEGIETIRENHTSLEAVVDKTIVETTQLWFSKANTTAPAKPTVVVTSTSTAGNAWRIVVPAYNASYPNYFYCYQWKYADGSYGWSNVTRDIAMGESQSIAREASSAASTANSGLASYITSNNLAMDNLDNKIDDISIGARNILRHTEDPSEDDVILINSFIHYSNINGTVIRLHPNTKIPYAMFKSEYLIYDNSHYKPGKYTVSFDAMISSVDNGYNNVDDRIRVVFGLKAIESASEHLNNTNGKWNTYIQSGLTNRWKRLSHTFILPDDLDTGNLDISSTSCYIVLDISSYKEVAPVVFRKVKIEQGNKATDWTPAPEDLYSEMNALQQSLQNQIDEQVDIWYYNTAPTTSNAPFNTWTDTETKDKHVGDLYFDTSRGYSYKLTKSGSTYSWTRIKDSDIDSALSAANTAQTTADNKRRIFTSTPTVPYDIGDLWVKGNEVHYANKARTSGSYTASEWTLTATDDTLAKSNIKSSVQLWFTKANTTAPSAPTAQVASTATSGNVWTTVVPTYNASYPYYFYCWQYQKGDNTYSWSPVVYDRATTENQQNSHAALTGLSTKVESTVFNNLVDTVGEHSSTITSLSTKVENLKIGGRNLLYGTTSWPDDAFVDKNNITIDGDTITFGANITPNRFKPIQVSPNEELTIGFDVRSDTERSYSGNNQSLILLDYSTSTGVSRVAYKWLSFHGDYSVTTDWNRVNITFIVPNNSDIGRLYVSLRNDTSNVPYQIRKIKVERGNKATDWTPAPEDMATASSVTTVTNLVNTVQQTANSNYATIQELQTITSNLETAKDCYPNYWRFDRYSYTSRFTANSIIPTEDDFIADNFIETKYIHEDNYNTGLSFGNKYIARIQIYIFMSDVTSISLTPRHDDAAAYYLNGTLIHSYAGVYTATDSPKTVQFNAGWNKILILLNEWTGGEYAFFYGIKPSQLTNAAKVQAELDPYDDTTVRRRISSVEQDLDGFRTTVSETYATTTSVTTLDNKINNISIGGRNLLRNTEHPTEKDVFLVESFAVYSDISGDVIRLHPTTAVPYVTFKSEYLIFDSSHYKPGEYTLSLDVIISGVDNGYLSNVNPTIRLIVGLKTIASADNTPGSGNAYWNTVVIDGLTREWQRFSHTFNIPDDLSIGKAAAMSEPCYIFVEISTYKEVAPTVIRKVKLEQGNIVTDWSPAPEDTIMLSEANLVSYFQTSLSNTSYWRSLSVRNTTVTGVEGTKTAYDIPSYKGGPGWAHITLDSRESAGNTDGKNCYMNFHLYGGVLRDIIKTNSPYTWLIEVSELTITGNVSLYINPSVGDADQDVFSKVTLKVTKDGVYYATVTSKTDYSVLLDDYDTRGHAYLTTGGYADFHLRISLYEGAYTGQWKPYVPVSQVNTLGTNLTNEINQRKALYGTSSTATGTAAKVVTCANFILYTGSRISVTFTNANTAATPTLNVNGTGAKQIRSYVGVALAEGEYKWDAGSTLLFVYDGTYWRLQDSGSIKRLVTAETKIDQNATAITLRATKTEVTQQIGDISIGGTNLLRNTANLSSDKLALARSSVYDSKTILILPNETQDGFAKLKVDYLDYAEFKNGKYTVSFDVKLAPVETEYTNVEVRCYIGFSVFARINNAFSSSHDRFLYRSLTNTVSNEWVKVFATVTLPNDLTTGQTDALVDGSQLTVEPWACHSGKPVLVRNIKLEKGDKATDWTPAPEDLQTVVQAQSELTITNNNIASKVSTTDYTGAIIASKINQSADSVKIQAKHVEIDGTAIFGNSAFQSGLDAALNNIQVGGRNLLLKSDQISRRTNDNPNLYNVGSFDISEYGHLIQGATYTITIEGINNGRKGLNPFIGGSSYGCGSWHDISGQTDVKETWIFTATSQMASANQYVLVYASMLVGSNGSTTISGTFTCTHVKLEQGNKATDWTPAPEDLYSYTDSGLNNLSVGGRNYILNSSEEKTVNKTNASTNVYIDYYLTDSFKQLDDSITEYTISLDIKAVNPASLIVDFYVRNSTGTIYTTEVFLDLTITNTMYKRVSRTVHMPTQLTHAIADHVRVRGRGGTGQIYVKNIKIEQGNKATDWTPAPEDLYSYTDNSIDNVSIGGRNLLLGTKDWSNGLRHGTKTSETYLGLSVATVTGTSDSNRDVGTFSTSKITRSLEPGKEYTLSFWAKASANTIAYSYLYTPDCVESGRTSTGFASNKTNGEIANNITTEWLKHWITWKVKTEGAPANCLCLRLKTGNTNTVYICGAKLEEGNKATDWSPAPEDLDSQINAVAEALNGFTILWNYSDFSTSNNGESYLCKWDPVTSTASNENGWVVFNGVKRTISKQMANPNGIIPFNIPIYLVYRLSSETATTGTNYMVFYSSGWKYTIMPTPTAIESTGWTWNANTDIILGKWVQTAAEGAQAECEIYNPPLTAKHVTTDTVTARSASAEASIVSTNLSTEINQRKAAYGTCSTAASTQTKDVACSNFEYVAGNSLTVYFSTANSYASGTVNLNVNGKGAKAIIASNATTSTTNQFLWGAGAYITFRYTGSAFMAINEPRVWYGLSDTAAATAAKTDTTACTGAVICKGTSVVLGMIHDNTNTAPTLNIQSTGAKAVYIGPGTTRPTKDNAFSWLPNTTVKFDFDGSAWRIGGDTYIQGDHIITGTLDASVVDVTNIKAENITSGKIKASQLAVTDMTNYCQLNESTASAYGFTVETDANAAGTPWFVRTSLTRSMYISEWFDCRPNEYFRVSGETSSSVQGATTNGGSTIAYLNVRLGIAYMNIDGTTSSALTTICTSSSSAPATYISKTATVGANAIKFRVFVNLTGYAPFSGTLKVRRLIVERMANGELIVDGSITADKISTNTLTVGNFANETIQLIGTANGNLTSEIDKRKAKYGSCGSSAGSGSKVVTCSNFELYTGAEISVTFTNANTYNGASMTMNVNDTGAKGFKVAGANLSDTNVLLWGAGATIVFRYDGSKYVVVGEPRTWYGASTTAEGTATKTDNSLGCTGIVLCKGTQLVMRMAYRNSNSSVALNIQGTGAFPVYCLDRLSPTIANGYSWTAGTTQTFMFDGASEWRTAETASITAVDMAGEAARTATDYVAAIAGGIKIFPYNGSSTNYLSITSDGTEVVKNATSLAQFGTDVRVGASASSHINITGNKFSLVNSSNNTYFSVADNRLSTGKTHIIEFYNGESTSSTGTSSNPQYKTSYPISNIDNVKVYWYNKTQAYTFNSSDPYYNSTLAITGQIINTTRIDRTSQAKSALVTNGLKYHDASGYALAIEYDADNVAPYEYTLGNRVSGVQSGINSVAIGKDIVAYGINSHAEGLNVETYGRNSTGFGEQNSVIGDNSFATGYGNMVNGANSFVTGARNLVEGSNSIVFGVGCKAGSNNKTTQASLAGGLKSTSGDLSFVLGTGLTGSTGQFVCGSYNYTGVSARFVVGNGSSTSDRVNAFYVSTSNTAYVGSTQVTSDERVKTDISEIDIDEAYEFISELKPKSYKKFDRPELGFIAQDVEKLVYGDILVDESPNFGYEDFKNLSYEGIIAPVVAVEQGLIDDVDDILNHVDILKAENDRLKEENKELTKKTKELESRLARIESMLGIAH